MYVIFLLSEGNNQKKGRLIVKLPKKRSPSEVAQTSQGKAKKAKTEDVQVTIKDSLRTYVLFFVHRFSNSMFPLS